MSPLTKLALTSTAIFAIGIIAVVLSLGDGVGTIIDTYNYSNERSGMHYYFVVRTSKTRIQTMEVTEAVYNSHGYGDIYNPSWCKNDGYQETHVEPMGADQGRKPNRRY